MCCVMRVRATASESMRVLRNRPAGDRPSHSFLHITGVMVRERREKARAREEGGGVGEERVRGRAVGTALLDSKSPTAACTKSSSWCCTQISSAN